MPSKNPKKKKSAATKNVSASPRKPATKVVKSAEKAKSVAKKPSRA